MTNSNFQVILFKLEVDMIGKFYVKKQWNWAQQVSELWNLLVAENAIAVVCIEYIDIKIKV